MTLNQIRKQRLSLLKITDELIFTIANTEYTAETSSMLNIACNKHRVLSNHIQALTKKETDLLSK